MFEGREITGMKVWYRRRLGIGRTYQVPKPFAHMSVFENAWSLRRTAAAWRSPTAREEAKAALELAGLAR